MSVHSWCSPAAAASRSAFERIDEIGEVAAPAGAAVEAKAPRASSAPAAPVVPEEASVGAALGRSASTPGARHVNIFRQALDEVKAVRTPVAFYCPVCGWEIDYGASPAEGKGERCPRCGARFRLTLRDGEWDPARV